MMVRDDSRNDRWNERCKDVCETDAGVMEYASTRSLGGMRTGGRPSPRDASNARGDPLLMRDGNCNIRWREGPWTLWLHLPILQ